MGIAVSLILIAIGAILVWGVTAETSGLDVDAVGVILMIIGFAAFLLSLLFWRSWWGPGPYVSRRTYVERGRDVGRRSRRVVEEEDAGGPPPGPPPP
jgi:hypothetical protein